MDQEYGSATDAVVDAVVRASRALVGITVRGARFGQRRGHAAAAPHARGRVTPRCADGERARRPARRARVHDDSHVQPARRPAARGAQAVGHRPARSRDRAHRAGTGSRRRGDAEAPRGDRRSRSPHHARRSRSRRVGARPVRAAAGEPGTPVPEPEDVAAARARDRAPHPRAGSLN